MTNGGSVNLSCYCLANALGEGRDIEREPATSAGYAIRTPRSEGSPESAGLRTAEGAELALAERNERHAWLDARLDARSPEDQLVIARACALLGEIPDS